jgi:hypothetical protein
MANDPRIQKMSVAITIFMVYDFQDGRDSGEGVD